MKQNKENVKNSSTQSQSYSATEKAEYKDTMAAIFRQYRAAGMRVVYTEGRSDAFGFYHRDNCKFTGYVHIYGVEMEMGYL